MNVVEMLRSVAGGAPGRDALIESGCGHPRRVTFAELDARVTQVAGVLRSGGVRPGDRVLLAVPLSIETYVALLATLKAGAVVMFVDPGQGAGVVARCLRTNPPAAVIGSPAVLMLRHVCRELARIPLRFVITRRRIAARHSPSRETSAAAGAIVARAPADSALLSFTSGSTGDPKPVVRTHGLLRRQLEMLGSIADVKDGDVELVGMPMFVLFNLAHGVTSVLPGRDAQRPGSADPRDLYARLAGSGATRLLASPALLGRLARHCRRTGRRLPALRRIATGGGPVPPQLAGELRAIAPEARLLVVYGSTEAEPIACIADDLVSVTDRRAMREGHGLLVGLPVRGCAVRILRREAGFAAGTLTSDGFDAVCGASGEIGEIVVSGGHVLPGYADPARDGGTKFDVDGSRWHRTGDSGYFDERGRLWLVGRTAAAISDAWGTVYPFQVEYAAAAVPGIVRSALIRYGGKRTLVVQVRKGRVALDCGTMARCIARHRIERVIVLRRIPVDRRHNAKIDYAALERRLAGFGTRWRLAAAGATAAFGARIHGIVGRMPIRRCRRG